MLQKATSCLLNIIPYESISMFLRPSLVRCSFIVEMFSQCLTYCKLGEFIFYLFILLPFKPYLLIHFHIRSYSNIFFWLKQMFWNLFYYVQIVCMIKLLNMSYCLIVCLSIVFSQWIHFPGLPTLLLLQPEQTHFQRLTLILWNGTS